MCVTPFRVPTGELVNCGTCEWCRKNRVLDFVGRCLAEAAFASRSIALTLTYSGDVVNATSLYYVDVQRMLYRLRTDGFSVRYICAGEHGEKKGRAHWHVVLFFSGKFPVVPLESRFVWHYWPHGFSYAQQADYGGFRYLLKYTLKDNESRGHKKVLRVSKKPPLGALYFEDLAQRLVDNRLAVHSPEYSFADVLGYDDGFMRPRKFWLVNRSLELFLEAYVRKWQAATGLFPPDTQLIWERVYDREVRRERELSPVDFEAAVESRKLLAREFAERKRALARKTRVSTGFLLLPPYDLVVRYSDGSAVLIWGLLRWRLRVGDVNGVRLQLSRCGLEEPRLSVASEWLCREEDWVRTPLIMESARREVGLIPLSGVSRV